MPILHLKVRLSIFDNVTNTTDAGHARKIAMQVMLSYPATHGSCKPERPGDDVEYVAGGQSELELQAMTFGIWYKNRARCKPLFNFIG